MRKRQIFKASLVILAAMSLPVHAEERGDWPADCKLERVSQVPMTLISGHVTVHASVNGKDFIMGVDTGGLSSGLTTAAYNRLGIAGHRGNLRIGDLEWDYLNIVGMEAFPGVDGLIAPDILDRYDAEIDFNSKTFNLFKPHPCSGRAVYWVGSYTVVPFTLTRFGHVRVPVTLDGQTTYAILDTGAPVTALSMQDASSMFGLTPDSANIEAAGTVSGPWSTAFKVGFNTFETRSAHTYPFQALTIGGVTIPNPPAELIDGRNFLGSDLATIVLGNDVLSRFHIYVAYHEQKLYITEVQAH